MRRKLVRTGNSEAMIFTRDMKDHLQLEGEVEVRFVEGAIIITRPLSFEEADAVSRKQFDSAYERLAQ